MKYLKLSAVLLAVLFPGCADRAEMAGSATLNSNRPISQSEYANAPAFASDMKTGSSNAAANS